MRALLWASLLAPAAAVGNAVSRSWSKEEPLTVGSLLQEESSKVSPVKRVIRLLQEMQVQLQKDAAADSAAYEKMTCWCESNEKAKNEAVKQGEARITELEAEVETRGGRRGELGERIAQLKRDLEELRQTRAAAEALREREKSAFEAEEAELVQAVAALRDAITVLSKHHAGLIQLTPAIQESLGAALRWAALKHEELQALTQERGTSRPRVRSAALLSLDEQALRGSEAAGDEAVLRALRGSSRPATLPLASALRVLSSAAAGGAALVQGAGAGSVPEHLQPYKPRSGQIYGILQRMLEEFKGSLTAAQERELQAQEAYVQLRTASDARLTAGTAALDDLEEDHSANAKALSDAHEDLTATRETRGADVAFLSDLRLKCQALEREWGTRSSTRGEELKAVSEAISILTEDDARDLFHKKLGEAAASFLQRGQGTQRRGRAARARAAALLRSVAQRQTQPEIEDEGAHPQLAAMAVRVQLDAFTRVKKAIDDMVAELKQQQQAEVEHKANCTAELSDNEKMTHSAGVELKEADDLIATLEERIRKATEGIAAAQTEIARMEVEVKKAGEVRELENKDFQQEVSDQRAMQNILAKAVARLKAVYEASLLQEDPTPPVQFTPYSKNAGGHSVISLLQAIVKDSKAAEASVMAAEQEAQKDYELMVTDSNNSIKGLSASIVEKTKAKAAANVDLEEAQAHKQGTETRLQDLADSAADLHRLCDFVLKNFEVRQKARLDEIEALQGAKALLSGMSADDD